MWYESLGRFVGITFSPLVSQSTKTPDLYGEQVQFMGHDETTPVDNAITNRATTAANVIF